MDQITHTLFLSPKCQLKTENDYRSVVATAKIKAGELLVVEHCYYQDRHNLQVMKTSVLFQKDLFNEALSPGH